MRASLSVAVLALLAIAGVSGLSGCTGSAESLDGAFLNGGATSESTAGRDAPAGGGGSSPARDTPAAEPTDDGGADAGEGDGAPGDDVGGEDSDGAPVTDGSDGDALGEEPSAPPDDAPDVDEGGTDEGEPEPDLPDDIQSGTLTAGVFDDNLNPGVFEAFAEQVFGAEDAQDLPEIALGERFIISVANEQGAPVADVRVIVREPGPATGQNGDLLDLTTGSDGRVLFATGIDGGAAQEYDVSVVSDDGTQTIATATFGADASAWEITLDGAASQAPQQLDLAFVIDATGSMGDELEYLKVEIDNIAAAVADLFPGVDQRFALIVYRDQGDIYITKTSDFTGDLNAFRADLAAQSAAGGGDYPEAMEQALEEAGGLSWRERGTARVLFLVADAPPHREDAQQALDAVLALRAGGVATYPVAASGVAAEAELLMRAAAMLTMSQYVFLTDDSGVGSEHAEPHIPCYHVQRLDQALIRMISNELSGEALQPAAADIIRTVGNPVDGVCVEQQ